MRLLLTGIAMLWAAGLTAADYFLSPAGHDAAVGSREAPWKTVAKANATLGPGDNAIFLAGSYDGGIVPARSGEPGKPIGYRAETPGQVTLRSPDGPTVLIRKR